MKYVSCLKPCMLSIETKYINVINVIEFNLAMPFNLVILCLTQTEIFLSREINHLIITFVGKKDAITVVLIVKHGNSMKKGTEVSRSPL